jgi:biopolymer transport protein ExbD
MPQLRSKLNGYAGDAKPPVVRIRGDGQAYYEKFAQLMNELQKVGLTRFTIDTQTEK